MKHLSFYQLSYDGAEHPQDYIEKRGVCFI